MQPSSATPTSPTAAGSEADRAVLREHIARLPDVLLELNAIPGQAARALEKTRDPVWLSRGRAVAYLWHLSRPSAER